MMNMAESQIDHTLLSDSVNERSLSEYIVIETKCKNRALPTRRVGPPCSTSQGERAESLATELKAIFADLGGHGS